jgi:hypothetical protein
MNFIVRPDNRIDNRIDIPLDRPFLLDRPFR